MAHYPSNYPYAGYQGGPYQYAYDLQDQTVQRLPSGIFFDPNQIGFDRQQLDSLEKGVDPLYIFSAFQNLDSGYVSANSGTASTSNPGSDLRCLPLLDVDIQVHVQSTISTTKVTQTFTNVSNHTIKETNYSFPLYDGSAVISFKCHVGEDKLLEGIVKPKEAAQKDFKEAVEKQMVAALLEEHTPEVFETKLGNIPAKTIIKVEIAYVNELKVDIGGEGVLVTLPTSIAPRYGTPPPHMPALLGTEKNGLHITVNVLASEPLRKLESRTHPISVEMGTNGTSSGPTTVSSFAELANAEEASNDAFDTKKAKATLSERHVALGRDFVLLILASEASILSSGAQLEEAAEGDSHSAMKLTLNPRDLFWSHVEPESFKGEVIFIADRSGSMGGTKMDTLKDALSVFLKSLSEEMSFNIYSFGSNFSSLWPQSRSYTDINVKFAMDCVSNFTADMGGTEILEPIRDAVAQRIVKDNFSTQIIVLTDGETWDEVAVREFVRDTRSQLNNAVRFFALGIGQAVSHRLVEGIGTEGGGFSEVVDVDGRGRWEGRVIRMLKGALTPESYHCELEFDGKPMKSACSSTEGSTFLQAPSTIPPLHPFSRTSIYFLFDKTYGTELNVITVKSSTPSGNRISVEVPMSKVTGSAYAVHHLAAKAIVMDLETDDSWLHSTMNNSKAGEAAVKELAERLAIPYHVTSRWTSFLAVETKSDQGYTGRFYKAPRTDFTMLNTSRIAPIARFSLPPPPLRNISQGISTLLMGSDAAVERGQYKGVVVPRRRGRSFGLGPAGHQPSRRMKFDAEIADNHDEVTKAETTGTSERKTVSEGPNDHLPDIDSPARTSPFDLTSAPESWWPTLSRPWASASDGKKHVEPAEGSTETDFGATEERTASPTPQIPKPRRYLGERRRASPTPPYMPTEEYTLDLQNLIRIQSAEGWFLLQWRLEKDVRSNFKPDVTATFRDRVLGLLDADGLSWTGVLTRTMQLLDTILVVTWIKMVCAKDKDVWELLVAKAERWIKKVIEDEEEEQKLWDIVNRHWVHTAGQT